MVVRRKGCCSPSLKLSLDGFLLRLLLFEENLINREIQKELERRADRGGNRQSRAAGKRELIDTQLEDHRIQPCGEADEGNRENDINRQRNCCVRAGPEGLLLIDEKRDDLRHYIRCVCRDKQRQAAALPLEHRIIKHKPVERRRAELLNRRDIIKDCEHRELNDTGA